MASVNAGLTQNEAANHYGCSQSEVSRLLQKWRQTRTVEDRPRSGRPRKTNQCQDRHLLRMARQNRFLSAMRLRNQWQAVHGQRVSRELVNKRLLQAGYRARRPRIRPRLL